MRTFCQVREEGDADHRDPVRDQDGQPLVPAEQGPVHAHGAWRNGMPAAFPPGPQAVRPALALAGR